MVQETKCGMNQSHTLAYSLIALQEMNLAYFYPTIIWNCACLIVDSGSMKTGEEDEEVEENEVEEVYEDTIENFVDDEDDDDEEVEEVGTSKKKKKTKSCDYDKVASAIGKAQTAGITIAPPSINTSTYTFSPNVEQNCISYGLSGIVKVGQEIVNEIIKNRPYTSIEDLLLKVKMNKPQIVNLIKCGALDEFGDRETLMNTYIDSISDKKSAINLRNMQMLIEFGLIPDEYKLQRRVFNFNKYLKKFKKDDAYLLDESALAFIDKTYTIDNLISCKDSTTGLAVSVDVWDKIYKKEMDVIRPWVKEHEQELIQKVNNKLRQEVQEKYADGNISKWEMDSISLYFHEHELKNMNNSSINVSDFFKMSENPEIDKVLSFKGKSVPIYKIRRIAGTVLARDKNHQTITLLTTTGLVQVKIYGEPFANYNKQISMRGYDGKKHITEKSWFTRGEKLVISGIRRGNTFFAKKYNATPYHLIERILKVEENGKPVLQHERVEIKE